jgi:hypothetical protein
MTNVNRPTARVSRLGWEGGLAVETEKTQSHENAKKRGAYPKSAARCVSPHYLESSFESSNSFSIRCFIHSPKTTGFQS